MSKQYIRELIHEDRKNEIKILFDYGGGELRCFTRLLIGIYDVESIVFRRYHKNLIYSFEYLYRLIQMRTLEGVLNSLNKIPRFEENISMLYSDIRHDIESIMNMIDNKIIEIREDGVYHIGFEIKSVDNLDSQDIQRIIMNEILKYISHNNYNNILNSLAQIYSGILKILTNIIQGWFDVCDDKLFSFDLFIFEDMDRAYEEYRKKSIFKDSYSYEIFEREVYSSLLEYIICKILYYEIYSNSRYTMDIFNRVDTSYLIRLG